MTLDTAFFVWLGWSTSSIATGEVLIFGCFLLVVLSLYVFVAQTRLSAILLIAFSLRFSIGVLQQFFQILPYKWDENFYHVIAESITLLLKGRTHTIVCDPNDMSTAALAASNATAAIRSGSLLANVFNGNNVYGFFSAVFYLVIGESPLTMRIVNSIFGTLVTYYTYCTSVIVFSKKKGAVDAALLTAIVPSFVVFSSLHMRDSLISLLSLMALYQFVLWLKFDGKHRVLLVIFFAMVAVVLRPPTFPLFVVALFPFALFKIGKTHWPSFFGRILIIAVVLLAVVATFSVIKDGLLPGFDVASDLQRIEGERDWRALKGGGAYLVDQTYQTWSDVFINLPLRVVHFSFGPFLWQAENWFQTLAAVEGVFFLMVVFLAFYWVMRNGNRLENPELLACIFWFGLVGICANAIVDSNYGTAIRHRMNYMTIFLIVMCGLHRQSVDSRE